MSSLATSVQRPDVPIDAKRFAAKVGLLATVLRTVTPSVESADFHSPLQSDPEEMTMRLFADMKTEDIIRLMSSDKQLAHVFMGAEKPNAAAGEEVAPTSRLMLMLLEREYGLTANPKKCLCSVQFVEDATVSFEEWLKSTQPKNKRFDYLNQNTISSVKALLEAILYKPPPTKSVFLVAGGIMFRFLEQKLVWTPYINHYAKKAVASPLMYWTSDGQKFDFKDAQIISISVHKKVRGVVTQLWMRFLINGGTQDLAVKIADRLFATEERYSGKDAPYLPSLFWLRVDAASVKTSYESGQLSFWSGNQTQRSFGVRDDNRNYIDYESFAVILQYKKQFRVAVGYLYVPNNIEADDHPQMITLNFTKYEGLGTGFRGFLRLDRKNGTQRFVMAAVFLREEDTTARLSIHVVKAREDRTLYYAGQFDVTSPKVRSFDIPAITQSSPSHILSETEIKFIAQSPEYGETSRDATTISIYNENAVTKTYSFDGVDSDRINAWYQDAFQVSSGKLESTTNFN